jgi:hypothetical protein
MKKVLMLSIVFFMTNMVAQNYCAAQAKLKPEYCSYFQTVDRNNAVHEWIWVGFDRSGKNLKWLDLQPNNKVLNCIELSRDEWTIYLQDEESKQKFEANLFKQELKSTNGADKIQNNKQSYDYSKLGGEYIVK